MLERRQHSSLWTLVRALLDLLDLLDLLANCAPRPAAERESIRALLDPLAVLAQYRLMTMR